MMNDWKIPEEQGIYQTCAFADATENLTTRETFDQVAVIPDARTRSGM
jgi:hypothetical protein